MLNNPSNVANFGPELQYYQQTFVNKTEKMRRWLTKLIRIFECGTVQKCVSTCKSCRSRQELSLSMSLFSIFFSNEIAIQTSIYLQNLRRYSRQRASQSLPQISHKLEEKLRKNLGRTTCSPSCRRGPRTRRRRPSPSRSSATRSRRRAAREWPYVFLTPS